MGSVARFLGYTLALFACAASLPAVVRTYGIAFFAENGPLEWLQLGLLLGAACAYGAAAVFRREERRLYALLVCVVVFAAVRELDRILDAVLPFFGWKIGFAALAVGALLACAQPRRLRTQLARFFATRAFGMTWAAFVVAVPLGQLVGHGPFLALALGDDYAWGYKQMLEEIFEAAGYLLLLFAAVESHFQRRAPRPMAARAAMPVASRARYRPADAAMPRAAPSGRGAEVSRPPVAR